MVTANFENERHPIVYGATQWNYGEVLRIQGLNLQKAVEVHFCLKQTAGQAIPRIGTTKDGVTDVVIPDSMLENEDELQDYFIYVWIYITNETSGRTEHSLAIKVKARSKPEIPGGDDNADPFREAIEAVNSAAERAEIAEQQAGQHAEQTKADAIKTGTDRQEVEKLVDSVSGISEQVQTVKEYKDQAQTAATNALQSEQASTEAKEAAIQAQSRAESAADEAEQHSLEVAGDKAEVERLATQVRQDKTAVEQTAQGFESTASQAVQSMQSAKAEAVKEVQAKGQEVIDSLKITNRIELSETDTAVELEPNKLYVFPKMENLTYGLKEPTDKNIANEYHFVFQSGASPTQVVHPVGVKIGNFSVEANKIYEVSIMENLLTSQSWAV